jgi:hypothetical protein
VNFFFKRVILSGVPPRAGGGGTQSKDPALQGSPLVVKWRDPSTAQRTASHLAAAARCFAQDDTMLLIRSYFSHP